MIQHSQQIPAKNVFAKPKEVTPFKLLQILTQIWKENSNTYGSYKRLEAVSCIHIGLRSCQSYRDDKYIVQACLSLEGHFRTIAPYSAQQTYLVKITSIMNACRTFLNTQGV